MNAGPLWIRVSYNPASGRLWSISNMPAMLEVAALELVKLDVRENMKRGADVATPIVSQHPGLQVRRVDGV